MQKLHLIHAVSYVLTYLIMTVLTKMVYYVIENVPLRPQVINSHIKVLHIICISAIMIMKLLPCLQCFGGFLMRQVCSWSGTL